MGIEDLCFWLEQNLDSCFVVFVEIWFGLLLVEVLKIVCVGFNYVQYVKESGMDVFVVFVLFFKAIIVICGFNDDIIIFKNSEKIDWEVELAIVIGKWVFYIEEVDVMEYVVGYVLYNDVSECVFQLE